jgi:hypothetical protein
MSLLILPLTGSVPHVSGHAAPVPSPVPSPAADSDLRTRTAPDRGTPLSATAVRSEFAASASQPERPEAPDRAEAPRRWSLAEVLGAIGKAPGPEAILARADRPGPVEPGSLLEAVKALRASLPSHD